MTAPGLRRGTTALAAMCAGLVTLVVGMFLPWLTSGRVQRSSFQAGAAVRTLLDVHGAAGTALRLWPALVAVASVALALVALGLPRLALPVAGVAGLVGGAAAIAVLAHPARGLVHPATSGPIVTLVGAALTCLAIPGYFLQRARFPRRFQ